MKCKLMNWELDNRALQNLHKHLHLPTDLDGSFEEISSKISLGISGSPFQAQFQEKGLRSASCVEMKVE